MTRSTSDMKMTTLIESEAAVKRLFKVAEILARRDPDSPTDVDSHKNHHQNHVSVNIEYLETESHQKRT